MTDEQNIVPCAAPHILVRKFNKEDMSFSSVAVLGYRLPKDSFTTSAFIRRGNSLVQEGVSDRYADIWRIGSTVTDTAGFLEYCHADRSMHLTKKSYISDCEFSTAHWARETLLRTALYRLQGKKIRPGVLRVDPNTKLPMTAARAVTQLKNFPKSDNATIDNSHLQYVISSSTESRAMALRMADDVAYNGPVVLHFSYYILLRIISGRMKYWQVYYLNLLQLFQKHCKRGEDLSLATSNWHDGYGYLCKTGRQH